MLPTRHYFSRLLWLPALAILATSAAAYTLTNEWSLRFKSLTDSAPAVGTDGTIYLGTRNGSFWAINPDGSQKWIFHAQNEIKSSPAIALDGTSYFGSRDRRFYAVRANGKALWEFATGGWVDSSPALARDGTIYFGSWDKRFYALKPDGSSKWQFQTQGPVVSSPAIGADGTVYFGSHDAKFYALAADGQKRWEFSTGGPITSSPALDNGQCVYFTSVDGWLYALELDGRLRWRLHTGGITESSPVIGPDGTIYVGVTQYPWAVNFDGTKRWGQDPGSDVPLDASLLVLADGSICTVSRSGLLVNYDPKLTMVWSYFLYCYGYGSPAVGPTGTIYVPDCEVQGLSALRADVPLARAPWPKFRGNARNTGNILDAAR